MFDLDKLYVSLKVTCSGTRDGCAYFKCSVCRVDRAVDALM